MERSYTTTEPSTYRDVDTLGVDMTRGVDLVGYKVEAPDGGIGKIDQANYDVGGELHHRRHRPVDFRQEGDDAGGGHSVSRPGHGDGLRRSDEG